MIALVHDLIITAGVYGILGFEITPAAVIGFLTILGYSLYDTVVVFDKIRENTTEDGETRRAPSPQSVNLAVNQTLVRSINTSVVALLPVGVDPLHRSAAARCWNASRHLARAVHRNHRRHLLDDLHRGAALLAPARGRDRSIAEATRRRPRGASAHDHRRGALIALRGRTAGQRDEAIALVAGGAVLLDVREQYEWDAGHVPDAHRSADVRASVSASPSCRRREPARHLPQRQRSLAVTEALVDAGYDAVNVAGGMMAWQAAGGRASVPENAPRLELVRRYAHD